MQWNCPHCGINLAVSDETIGSGWSFSRCYKCGGFALIRKAEINIIKVDKAPPGERIILPEASRNPSVALMGKDASQKMAKHMAAKSKVEPSAALKNASRQPSPAPASSSGSSAAAAAAESVLQQNKTNLEKGGFFSSFPDPLPDFAPTEKTARMLPYGITGAAALAIVSGFYLIMQGQTVWKKTHLASVSDEEAQNQRVQTVKHSPSESLATATKENVVVATQKQVSPILVDQVQQSAMAPMKLMPESDSVPKVELENLENSKIPAAREVKAPSLTTSQTTNANSPSFTVRVRLKKVNLHSGPGMSFPVVGSATPESVYTVADWSDRWFQISPKTATSAKTVGWIRNDLVQIINPGSAPARVASPDLNPFR